MFLGLTKIRYRKNTLDNDWIVFIPNVEKKMINTKFRKRPVVIEAFQMTEERRHDNSDWPEWLHKAWNNNYEVDENALFCDPFPPHEFLHINTLEGIHSVTWGDYIIKGIKGKLYPCTEEIFLATYEEVLDLCTIYGQELGQYGPSKCIC